MIDQEKSSANQSSNSRMRRTEKENKAESLKNKNAENKGLDEGGKNFWYDEYV